MLHRILCIAAATLFLPLLHALELLGQTREPMQSVEDSVFAGLVKPDEPGFAVLMRYKGKNICTRTEGVRDRRSKAKIDALTNFRLESFTKQFTAMAIVLLVHSGKLRYDQRSRNSFPIFPPTAKRSPFETS